MCAATVLHVIDHLGLGGAQTIVRELLESQEHAKGIFLMPLRTKDIAVKINHPNIVTNQSYSRYSFKPIKLLKEFIQRENISIIHCHLFRAQVFGWFLKKYYFPKIAVIFHEHGLICGTDNNSTLSYSKQIAYRFFLRLSKNSVNAYIAISNATKMKLIEKAHIPESKISVMYNFTNSEKYNKNNITWNVIEERELLGLKKADFVVGFAGRLVVRKGWKEVIESANILCKRYPDIKYLIAGDGKDRGKLLDLIKQYDLENKVIYIGYCPDMVKYYSLIDLLIVPSHWEPMGLIELEAQSMGIPVIASDTPALNEIIFHRENGLLFKLGDFEDLSRNIELLYKADDLKQKLVKNGSITVMQFNLAQYLEQLNNLYSRLSVNE